MRLFLLPFLMAVSTSVVAAAVPADPIVASSIVDRLALFAEEEVAAVCTRSAGSSLRVRVIGPELRVLSADPYHPATFRAGRLRDARVPFGDATYKARLELEVAVQDRQGRTTNSRRFTGRSAKFVRFPAPHPYRGFDSIHEMGRRHEPCAYYPELEGLLRRALHDALSGDEGAVRWAANLRR